MELDALQKKYDLFLEEAKKVRGWQKQYYKYYVLQDKQMMIMHQRKFDNMIAIEESERKKKQIRLPFEKSQMANTK